MSIVQILLFYATEHNLKIYITKIKMLMKIDYTKSKHVIKIHILYNKNKLAYTYTILSYNLP